MVKLNFFFTNYSLSIPTFPCESDSEPEPNPAKESLNI